MKYLNAKEAAQWLGVSDIAVYSVLSKNGIRSHTRGPGDKSFLLADVDRLTGERAAAAFARQNRTIDGWAVEIRDALRPSKSAGNLTDGATPMSAAKKLRYLDRDVLVAFGKHVITAAASTVPQDFPCRWHIANALRPPGSAYVSDTSYNRLLLGDACLGCKVQGTPSAAPTAPNPRPQTAVSRPLTASANNSPTKAARWRQAAARERQRGDTARAAAYERNARLWEGQ